MLACDVNSGLRGTCTHSTLARQHNGDAHLHCEQCQLRYAKQCQEDAKGGRSREGQDRQRTADGAGDAAQKGRVAHGRARPVQSNAAGQRTQRACGGTFAQLATSVSRTSFADAPGSGLHCAV